VSIGNQRIIAKARVLFLIDY